MSKPVYWLTIYRH